MQVEGHIHLLRFLVLEGDLHYHVSVVFALVVLEEGLEFFSVLVVDEEGGDADLVAWVVILVP